MFLQVADSYYNETSILKKKSSRHLNNVVFTWSSVYTIIIYTVPPLRVGSLELNSINTF